jgi:hypothetical protein
MVINADVTLPGGFVSNDDAGLEIVRNDPDEQIARGMKTLSPPPAAVPPRLLVPATRDGFQERAFESIKLQAKIARSTP